MHSDFESRAALNALLLATLTVPQALHAYPSPFLTAMTTPNCYPYPIRTVQNAPRFYLRTAPNGPGLPPTSSGI